MASISSRYAPDSLGPGPFKKRSSAASFTFVPPLFFLPCTLYAHPRLQMPNSLRQNPLPRSSPSLTESSRLELGTDVYSSRKLTAPRALKEGRGQVPRP